MTERKRRNEKALAARLYAQRHESAEWEDTPVDADVQSNRAVVTSLRLPVQEFVAMQKAAKSSNQTVSEFIRNAIAMKLRGNVTVNAVQVATGSAEAKSQATVLVSVFESGRTQNPGPDRMEAVPLYANILI